jgi:hypothetical protein
MKAGTTPSARNSGHPIRTSPVPGSAKDSISLMPLFQFIKNHQTPPEQCVSVDRGSNAPRIAIEKAHAQCLLQLRNRLGHRWLRYPEMLRSLGHAAPLRDVGKDVEIAQTKTPS